MTWMIRAGVECPPGGQPTLANADPTSEWEGYPCVHSRPTGQASEKRDTEGCHAGRGAVGFLDI